MTATVQIMSNKQRKNNSITYLDDADLSVQYNIEMMAGLALSEHILPVGEGHHGDVLGHPEQSVPVREVGEHLYALQVDIDKRLKR